MKPLRALCAGELPRLVMFDLDGTLVDSVSYTHLTLPTTPYV